MPTEQQHAPIVLPGEGETRTTVERLIRVECSFCGEPATYCHTFLLKGGRQNRDSSAFGKDDTSWCADVCTYTCGAASCETSGRRAPHGCDPDYCTFTAGPQTVRRFLAWTEVRDNA